MNRLEEEGGLSGAGVGRPQNSGGKAHLLPHSVTLYTRAGCHLCEDARRTLERLQTQFEFTIHTIDVETDPILVARYGSWVPVVTVDGWDRFRGFVNESLLRRLLGRKPPHIMPVARLGPAAARREGLEAPSP